MSLAAFRGGCFEPLGGPYGSLGDADVGDADSSVEACRGRLRMASSVMASPGPRTVRELEESIAVFNRSDRCPDDAAGFRASDKTTLASVSVVVVTVSSPGRSECRASDRLPCSAVV